MEAQILTAILVALALAAGAFASHWLERFQDSRQTPSRPEQIQKDAEALAQWIKRGQDEGIIDAAGKAVSEDSAKFSEWSKKAPFKDVVRGETLDSAERDRLTTQFWQVFAYLVGIGLLAGVIVFVTVLSTDSHPLILSLFSGLFGSAVAAFRSCLDRRANGFEDRWGNQAPDAGIAKERFGDGMPPWFFGRPLLGLAVAMILYCGLVGNAFPEAVKAEVLTKGLFRLAFYMMLAGLFAKTLLDIFLELAKKVLKV